MITVIKKIIIIKEKEGKRQGKKTHNRRDSNLGPLFQRDSITTWPRGLSRLAKRGLKHAKYFPQRNLKER